MLQRGVTASNLFSRGSKDIIHFIFHFIFHFLYFLFWNLGLGLVWCHTITKPSQISHMSQSHWKNIEDSGRMISYSIYNICQDCRKWTLFLFIFFLIFILFLIFTFSIFRALGLGLEVICHIRHIWWCSHNINHRIWEKEIEDSGTKWCHTTWTPHVGLMLYIWSFRVGCTVVSTDHLYEYIR